MLHLNREGFHAGALGCARGLFCLRVLSSLGDAGALAVAVKAPAVVGAEDGAVALYPALCERVKPSEHALSIWQAGVACCWSQGAVQRCRLVPCIYSRAVRLRETSHDWHATPEQRLACERRQAVGAAVLECAPVAAVMPNRQRLAQQLHGVDATGVQVRRHRQRPPLVHPVVSPLLLLVLQRTERFQLSVCAVAVKAKLATKVQLLCRRPLSTSSSVRSSSTMGSRASSRLKSMQSAGRHLLVERGGWRLLHCADAH